MTSFSPEPEFWVEDASEDWGDGSWSGGDDGAPPGGPPGSEQPPRGPRRWPRWVALAVSLAVFVGLIAWQGNATPAPEAADTSDISERTTTAPTGSTSRAPLVPGTVTASGAGTSSDTPVVDPPARNVDVVNPMPSTLATSTLALPGAPFELVGLQWRGQFGAVAAVVRYRSDTGELVRTEVSSVLRQPLSFVVTSDAAVIQPWNGLGMSVVPDGTFATRTGDNLRYQGQAFSAADGRHVWITGWDDHGAITLLLLDPLTGDPTGQTIPVPAAVAGEGDDALSPDGAGHVLVRAAGGTYDLTLDSTTLVTRGLVLAAGPTGYLVAECDEAATCSASVVDRATGDRTILDGFELPGYAVTGQVQGVISPDGTHAALIATRGIGGPLKLVDLRTGAIVPTMLPLSASTDDTSSLLAFTPDSSAVIVISGDYVRAVDPASGDVLGELPLPHLSAIAVRPVG